MGADDGDGGKIDMERESDLQKPTPLFMDEGTSAHQGCHFDTIIEMVWQYDSIGYYANYKPPQSSSYSS